MDFRYKVPRLEKGYANQTLYINLGTGEIKAKAVDQKMKDIFTGGKGFDLWLMWNSIPRNRIIKWDDPENEICISAGPLGGSIYPGAGKSIVTSISPLTGIPIDSNVGGYFGPFLKFSGWDAIEIQGKAKDDVVIFIDGDEGRITIEDGTQLPSETYILAELLTEKYGGKEGKKNVSVVSAGPGAEHTLMGCLNFSWYDPTSGHVRYKQAGRGGTGTVFRNKKIKALVCKYSGQIFKANNPADEKALQEVARSHTKEILELDPKQNDMRSIGTAHIPSIMNEFDLLPVHNFQYGSHPEAKNLSGDVFRKLFVHERDDGCWKGCAMACSHGVENYAVKTGPYKGKKVHVEGPEYETIAGCGSNIGVFDPEWVIEYNLYCDTYGIDTISFGTAMAFVMECYERGLIDKKITGGLDLHFGAKENVAEVLHQMAKGKGFGAIVGQGIHRMKKIFVEHGADPKLIQDIGMEIKGLEYSEYVTKESLAQQGGYGLALKGPQHDEAWLIFIDMVRNQIPTFEQKAEALHWFPMWRTWFSLNGLCKLPWNDVVPEDNAQTREPAKVMKHVEWYAKFFSAVTGRNAAPEDLIKMSERVYNFQRIFNLRMGQGTREFDEPVPYRSMGPVTKEEYESRKERYDKQLKEKLGIDPAGKSTEEKITLLRRYKEEQYHKLVDSVYQRRGWNKNGVPTLEKIKELGIDFPDVVELVKKYQ